MRCHLYVFCCSCLTGCVGPTPHVAAVKSDPGAVDFRYVHIPRDLYTLKSTMLVSAGGDDGPFKNALGWGLSADDLVSHVRRWKDVPGGPTIVIEMTPIQAHWALSYTRGSPLAELDDALARAGLDTRGVQVILEFSKQSETEVWNDELKRLIHDPGPGRPPG